MTTRKPVVDPDIEPEYDFSRAVASPYAERYSRTDARARAARIAGTSQVPRTAMLLEYDEAVDAAYLRISDAPWDHQVRLDDARGINYAVDGEVIGIELLSPRSKGVLLDGLPFPDDVARVARSVGFRVIEHPASAVVTS
ncbi:MAG: DUF2283 domain-containing protein [Chloroflexota bacterium]